MKQRWRRLGLVYAPDGSQWWARQHAMLPTPLMLDDTRLRVYFASTDENIVGRVGFLELDVREPTKVLRLTTEPVLDIGRAGAFDDSGVNPSCAVWAGDELRLYYVGYQLQRRIPYTLFTGCAVSRDGGEHFARLSEVPLLDRSDGEEFFRSAPFLRREAEGWRLWYIAGGSFADVAGKAQPLYDIRTLTSSDGITFAGPSGEVLTPRRPDEIGFGRPFVTDRDGGALDLNISVRSASGYRLGYAQSRDGGSWERDDSKFEMTGPVESWESEMTCYSAIVKTRHGTLMFYNGNGYGRTGFGVARAEF